MSEDKFIAVPKYLLEKALQITMVSFPKATEVQTTLRNYIDFGIEVPDNVLRQEDPPCESTIVYENGKFTLTCKCGVWYQERRKQKYNINPIPGNKNAY